MRLPEKLLMDMIPQEITRDHIVMAIKEIDSLGIPAGREAAKSYVSLASKKYPAKYVISIAGKYALGHEYSHKHSSEGPEINEFLKGKGFKIIQKDKHETRPLSLMLNGRTEWYENIYLSFMKHGRAWVQQTSPIGKEYVRLFEESINENGYFIAFGYEQKPVHKINYIFKIDKIFTNLKNQVQPDYTTPSFDKRNDAEQEKLRDKDDHKYVSWLSVSHVEIISPMDTYEFTNYCTSNALNISQAAHYYINTPEKYLQLYNRIVNTGQINDGNAIDSVSDPLAEQDAGKKTMATIDYRVCQMKFRQCLLSVYEGKCAITGCDVSDALEAVHIAPYLGDITNDVQNGLLLRADIHALFDLGKITISPADLRVILHRDLRNSQYSILQGKMISVPKMKSDWPSKLALEVHKKSSGL
jgi:hypothetical protein